MSTKKQMRFIVETLARVGVMQDKSERQLRELRRMAKHGMKMLADLKASQKMTDAVIRELAASRKH